MLIKLPPPPPTHTVGFCRFSTLSSANNNNRCLLSADVSGVSLHCIFICRHVCVWEWESAACVFLLFYFFYYCHFHAQFTQTLFGTCASTSALLRSFCHWHIFMSRSLCRALSHAHSLCMCACVIILTCFLLVFVHARVPSKFKLSFLLSLYLECAL